MRAAVPEDECHSRRFIAFFVCNTAALIASLRGIMLLMTIRSEFKDGGRWWYALYGHVGVALLGLVVAYGFGSCRETRSTVYVFCLLFHLLAYTAVQRYLVVITCRRLSSYWARLISSPLCACWAEPDDAPAKKRADTAVLLLATLAATITYQAGMNPPGGFWPDSHDGHKGGDPILLATHAGRYKVFFAFNSLALVTSVVVIAMVLLLITRQRAVHALQGAMILDVLSLTAAYAVGCGRDASTSLRVVALAGGILICVVIHIVLFTLHDAAGQRDQPALMKKKRKLLLLFAILVADVTYQAGLTPPGGFWLEDDAAAGHAAGYAVLADNYPRCYAAFFYCNAASFMSSVVIVILLLNPHMLELGLKCHALYLCAISGLFGLIGRASLNTA